VKLTRRRVLVAGATAVAAGAAAVGGVAVRWWDRPAGEGYRFLATEEAAFLRALAGAAFPPGDVVAVDGGEAGLDHFVDELLMALPETPRALVRTLFHALDAWPLPGRLSSFSALPRAERTRVLEAWLGHDVAAVRSAAQGTVFLVGMGYTSHPDVAPLLARWHGCGYGR
jgi:hypothetical protein